MEEDDNTYENHMNTGDTKPLPLTLRVHAIVQLITWAIIFPTGFVLGLSKSRYHVPCQIAGMVLTLPGFLLPHFAHERHPHSNAHTVFGSILACYMLGQVGCGIFLSLHIYQTSRFRRIVQLVHSFLGFCFPIISWIQLLLGGITGLKICFGSHTGQCLAYFITGSSFIFYGIVLLLMIHFGQPWLARRGFSQEFLDCCVVTAWGIINTFTARGFFFSATSEWSHLEMQHSTIGVFWALAGGLGIFLSRHGQRSVAPGLILIVTGWEAGYLELTTPYSQLVHTAFGYVLMAAGASKMADVCLLSDCKAWRHTTPFLLTAAGVMFLSSTDQQLRKVLVKQFDHPTYALIQISTAVLIYLFVNVLLNLYQHLKPVRETGSGKYECLEMSEPSEESDGEIKARVEQVIWSSP
ncbi:hypothetical protein CROQUDRAFT_660817 [Cronartium quercuum f. sp. fusiforme G11]|uniref:Cytochrome b561 domain-containing protein n=1 Tax=Cronartium quercuum f. sp. fusiforme G11 TaxID=708437 RepID=A0A9P6NBS5_9BASI|nr:hypothetical protein CROQUDRAFT_660817 [Cronartium quercuum f. sp. fusiforme G11]